MIIFYFYFLLGNTRVLSANAFSQLDFLCLETAYSKLPLALVLLEHCLDLVTTLLSVVKKYVHPNDKSFPNL